MTATTPTTETGIVELLRCPFCGEAVTAEAGLVGHLIDSESDCPLIYDAIPIAQWNTRAAMPDSTQLLQTMAGALEECQDKLWVLHFSLKDAAERQAAISACNMATAALAQFRAQEQRS